MHFDLRQIKHLRNQLDSKFVNLIYKFSVNAPKQPATVGKIVNGKYTTEYDKWCTAEFVDYSSFKEQIDIIKDRCILVVENNYNVKCLDFEIHFLHYTNGAYYKSHIDGQYLEDDTAKRGVDRDITCVVYLNDDYQGGNIHFDFFNTKIKPNASDILMYPTTWQFSHGVEPVIGDRYAIVFWFQTNPILNVDSKIVDKSIKRFLQSITS
jgi:Rps23 Pro-64 3,4-dihydroxylase Tpa1-like proline 4-hydroxylase